MVLAQGRLPPKGEIKEMSMHFIIYQEPIPKARPRVTRNGTYTPPRTKKAMNEVSKQVKEHPECPETPLSAPVSVETTFHVSMPKSWSKKKREAMLGEPVAKKQFDIDNLQKLIFDALNEILWEDDGQIWESYGKKVWSNEGKILLNVVE